MAVNIHALCQKAVEKNLDLDMLSKKIGLKPSIFNHKLHHNGSFTIEEADKIARILHLTSKEAMVIFFASFVA